MLLSVDGANSKRDCWLWNVGWLSAAASKLFFALFADLIADLPRLKFYCRISVCFAVLQWIWVARMRMAWEAGNASSNLGNNKHDGQLKLEIETIIKLAQLKWRGFSKIASNSDIELFVLLVINEGHSRRSISHGNIRCSYDSQLAINRLTFLVFFYAMHLDGQNHQPKIRFKFKFIISNRLNISSPMYIQPKQSSSVTFNGPPRPILIRYGTWWKQPSGSYLQISEMPPALVLFDRNFHMKWALNTPKRVLNICSLVVWLCSAPCEVAPSPPCTHSN